MIISFVAAISKTFVDERFDFRKGALGIVATCSSRLIKAVISLKKSKVLAFDALQARLKKKIFFTITFDTYDDSVKQEL